jgi:all-trans-retinol 13,14-reductase
MTTSNTYEHAGQPWSKHAAVQVPGGVWDTIVIGSGMGGMTTAAMLAKLGQRVLVLEQHYVPGGFTHMFKRKGYTWDVGVHAVGEVSTRSMPGRLLRTLTDDQLKWESLGPVYDAFHFPGDVHIDFPDSAKQFRENLVAAFPKEVAAIDEYLRLVREVSGGMRRYYLSRLAPTRLARFLDPILAGDTNRMLRARTADVVNGLTNDPHLRTVMCAQWGYYGAPPERSSFAMQALVVKHFIHGAYYPVGGAGRIAQTLLRTVANAGGWTRISSDVKQIVIEDERAVGVQLADGEVIRAKRVVSAAGPVPTLRNLLPVHYLTSSPWGKAVGALKPAPAHVCLYIGFKGDIRAAGASAANQWFYEVWSSIAEAWDVTRDPLPDAPVLYCSFPSLKDPTHDPGPDVRHTGEVVTFVPWELFTPYLDKRWMKRGDAYTAFKKRMEHALLEQLLRHMPQLRPLVDYVELSTPASTDHFVRPLHGSIYGLEPTPERFENPWLRPRSPIPGLFFSGSDMASVGVIGAMMGGVLCATAIDPIGALPLLRNAIARS